MAKREAGKRKAETARPGPKRGEAARRKIEGGERKLAGRMAKALALGEGRGLHLRAALAVVDDICKLHGEGERVAIPHELEARARKAGVDARRLWRVLDTPDAGRAGVDRAKAAELSEAARQDRRQEIEAALRFMAEDDGATGIRAAARPGRTGSEEARLRCELAAMEAGKRGAQAAAVMAELRRDDAEEEARLIALRVEGAAEEDADSYCEPWPESDLRAWLEHWRQPGAWEQGGPSAEALRRILGMSRQAVSAATRRGRWHKANSGRGRPLKPRQLANALRDYAAGGGDLAAEARRAAEALAGMSAQLRE